MAALVFFHAHPDDETVVTAGTIARYAREGHDVFLVVATMGEENEHGGRSVGHGAGVRSAELAAAARVLGVREVRCLGYRDSGMAGSPANAAPESFWQAELAEAADRLAGWLREWGAEVVTGYDDGGLYGHPDHVRVAQVARRAARLAGTSRTYLATVDRDHMRRIHRRLAATPGAVGIPDPDAMGLGVPAAMVTTALDVRPWAALKREAMRCHASQIPPDSFFLALDPASWDAVFGWEWYIRVGVPVARREGPTRESGLLGDSG